MTSTCLFCQIIAGEKPAYKIYEDDQFLAFLDIYPYGPGHTLVIPKTHYRWVWDVENIGEYMEVTRKLSLHISKTIGTETCYSMIIGEQVPHAHIHVVPPLFEIHLPQRKQKIEENSAYELMKQLSLLK